jgi:hypothetical protein
MMFGNARSIAAACLMLIAAAGRVEARQVSSLFEEVRAVVKPGDTVTVVDTVGRALSGQVDAISSTSLALVRKGHRTTFAESDVAEVRYSKRANVRRGAALGAGIGAGGAVALIVLDLIVGDGHGPCECAARQLRGIAYYAGLGAGIGVLSTAWAHEEATIVRSAAQSRMLTFSPLVTRGRRGVAVTYGF